MVFFQGTLQEGIATAIQESKSVVCFVTDNGAESLKWQNEYFTDDRVAALLRTYAVVLRLEAGSQEEGFLTQLYPVPKKPTVVVIKNGEQREYIDTVFAVEGFLTRLECALEPPLAPAPAPSPAQADQVTAPSPASPPAPSAPAAVAEPASSASSDRAIPSTAAAAEAHIQSLFAERAARLAAQKKKDEEEAKKRRIEKGKAKAESIAAGKAPDAQSKHAETLKRRQREAREERERVLKAIEDDKAARKARQAEKEALRRAASSEAAGDAATSSMPFAPTSQFYPSTGRIHENCALQVRLLDGSTIRSRFSSRDTLKDVRQWVDDTAQLGKTAYTLKILMTPLPSVKLDVTEEGKQLQELGLTPSATLILLPVRRRFADAYDDAPPPGNIFMRFLAYAVAYISGFFGVILSFIGTLFSTAGAPVPLVDSSASQGAASGRDGGQDAGARQRRNEQQFYNGNSTNFQPRVDDEDGEEYDN